MPGAVLEVGRRWQVRLDKSIGEGGFGAVFRAKDTKGSPPCDSAAKRVSLTNPVDKEAFHTELSVLHVVHDIESVIGLQGSADTGEHGWMFLEMATGGELFDRLIDSGSLSERKWPRTHPLNPDRCASRDGLLARQSPLSSGRQHEGAARGSGAKLEMRAMQLFVPPPVTCLCTWPSFATAAAPDIPNPALVPPLARSMHPQIRHGLTCRG